VSCTKAADEVAAPVAKFSHIETGYSIQILFIIRLRS